MEPQQLRELLEKVRIIAEDAGKAILHTAAEDIGVSEKHDGSPLTRADMASHLTIQSGLDGLEPRFDVLSEEGDLDNIEQRNWSTYWCVDPLDGTKEFIRNMTDYTVNIALVSNNKPLLGVIDVPALGVTYWGGRGLGAWRHYRDEPPEQIFANQCDRPSSAVVSRSHLDERTEQFLDRINVTNVIPHGSSMKICVVAAGQADIYPRFGPTYLWDTAAGAAIAIEAGCSIVDLAGEDLTYDPSENLKHAGFIVAPAGLNPPITEIL